MLYRPVQQPRSSLLAHLGHFLGHVGDSRRRRLAEIELRSLSLHMKRDLGLDGASLRDFGR